MGQLFDTSYQLDFGYGLLPDGKGWFLLAEENSMKDSAQMGQIKWGVGGREARSTEFF